MGMGQGQGEGRAQMILHLDRDYRLHFSLLTFEGIMHRKRLIDFAFDIFSTSGTTTTSM